MEQALRMDRMYALQRHIYDATRRFYLLGRDRLLEELPAPHGGAALEMGCGTGRNLAVLRRLRPDLTLCGLDVSARMLETAGRKLAGQNVRLARCQAEDLNAGVHFGLNERFDVVFYSYVLSMVPAWQEALEAGWSALKPGGTLAVVDFWGQGGLPVWLEWLHERWLRLYGVSLRPELLTHLRRMEKEDRARLRVHSVRGGYAYLAWVEKLE
ncbi:MAG: class I SAM-dependent methyltransferase [Acidobacteriota bacterium]